MTSDGKDAILALSEGDMRRVLNILQSTSMAYPEVNSKTVYLCTGSPQPDDINTIKYSLMNDTYYDCYKCIILKYFIVITKIKTENGLALSDILTSLINYIYEISFPSNVFSCLLYELSELEYRLTSSTSEILQLSSLIGIFIQARKLMENYKD